MSEPQIWSFIGVMAAGLFGVLGLMSTMFPRVIRSEIGGLRNEMVARFDGMDKRLDNLDQDVQYLMKREIER